MKSRVEKLPKFVKETDWHLVDLTNFRLSGRFPLGAYMHGARTLECSKTNKHIQDTQQYAVYVYTVVLSTETRESPRQGSCFLPSLRSFTGRCFLTRKCLALALPTPLSGKF